MRTRFDTVRHAQTSVPKARTMALILSSLEQQPLAAILIAGAIGYAVSWLAPHW